MNPPDTQPTVDPPPAADPPTPPTVDAQPTSDTPPTADAPSVDVKSGFWASSLHFDLRGRLSPLFVLSALLLPQGAVAFVLVGVALLVSYASMRVWVARYMGGAAHVHSNKAQKKRRLITEGPFTMCRNPLYVANALGTAGACFALGPAWLGPLALIGMLVWYSGVVRWEEGNLTELYPDEYPAYRASTPGLLPRRLLPKPGLPPDGLYPLGRAMRRERGVIFAVVVISLGASYHAGLFDGLLG